MTVYYQHKGSIYSHDSLNGTWTPVAAIPVSNIAQAIEDICVDVSASIDYDDHVLYLIEGGQLISICIYVQDPFDDSPTELHTYISTFCAVRRRGVQAFNMFLSTGLLGSVITLESVPYAVNFYKRLGFTVDDSNLYEGVEGKSILHPDIQEVLGDVRPWIKIVIPYSVIAQTPELWEDVAAIPMIMEVIPHGLV